ncbi:MAG: hypothetical protein ACLPKE_31185 [Streptosporangiaceae bacterium]
MQTHIMRPASVLATARALSALGLAGNSTAGAGAAPAPAPTAAFPARASWKIVKTVLGNNSPSFSTVTATGPHSAWAFESTSSRPAAWRLSGSRWTGVPFSGNTGGVVSSAASTSPDDVWAVESNGVSGPDARQRVLSWNGTGWAVTAGSFPGSGGEVVPLSPHDAWFFDGLTPGGATWHYNGHHWSHVPSGNGLTNGSALSADNIWAISATDVAHWNGHAWSRTSVKGLLAGYPQEPALCDPSLIGLHVQSPDSIWAVGTGHRETVGGPVVVLHFNGHHWTRAALSDAARDPVFGQVIPDGSGGLWIPTLGFEGRTPSTMLHYSRGQLEFAALPATPGRVLCLNAVAAVPGTRRAIGAGVTYWGNPIGTHQSAVILAYTS